MTLKQKVYNHYLQAVNDKIQLLQAVLADLKESSSNETKSTPGDKHETALAMLQTEQANIRGQLKDALAQKSVLEKINPAISTTEIVHGSLIKTSRGYLFMSVALGKSVIDNFTVMAISPQSPLGMRLVGLRAADITEMNNNQYVIENII